MEISKSAEHHSRLRVRAWKRNRAKWEAFRRDCASGRMLVGLAEAERARPYELGDVRFGLREVMSRPAIDLLEWLLAGELGFHGKRGVVLAHADAAKLCRVSRRRAGDAMRELVSLGLVVQRPHFRARTDAERQPKSRSEVLNGVSKRRELTPAYQTTARCREVVARKGNRCVRAAKKNQVGRTRQPGESHPALCAGSSGVRARRPLREFVFDVRRARDPGFTTEPAPVATVIERRADGSIALGSELSSASLSQRLRNEAIPTNLRALPVDEVAAAWASFEAWERAQ